MNISNTAYFKAVAGSYTLSPFDNNGNIIPVITIECDTTLGVITIDLFEISELNGRGNFRLNVVDVAGNASVNNITVQTTGTDIIDESGNTSLVIDANNSSIIISPISSTIWVGLESKAAGGGAFLPLAGGTMVGEIVMNPSGLKSPLNTTRVEILENTFTVQTEATVKGIDISSALQANAGNVALVGVATVSGDQAVVYSDAFSAGLQATAGVGSDQRSAEVYVQSSEAMISASDGIESSQININKSGAVKIFSTTGKFTTTGMLTFADNAAAILGGLVADDEYKTATGERRIVV